MRLDNQNGLSEMCSPFGRYIVPFGRYIVTQCLSAKCPDTLRVILARNYPYILVFTSVIRGAKRSTCKYHTLGQVSPKISLNFEQQNYEAI